MPKTFNDAEHHILNLFKTGSVFHYKGVNYIVQFSGKPICSKGEPKTDIYINAESANHTQAEFKISFKKYNADFLENKINAERAEQLFGSNWFNIISNATAMIKNDFLSRFLIYKNKYGKTDVGSITLGWKFELLNVLSGQLSGDMQLTQNQVIDVYSGTNLIGDKKDAFINGISIPKSGIANFIIFEKRPISTTQEAIDSLIPIKDYVIQNPKVYFACKALNYRTFKQKYDGNRPLAVYVNWYVNNGKLAYNLCFDTPLKQGGDYVYNKLKIAMKQLGAKTTNDLNMSNVENTNIIFE